MLLHILEYLKMQLQIIFLVISFQSWEFAHRISERIACFLPKNERMSDSLKKMSHSLIRSFLVSDLSESLTIVHFLWATWANHS